MKHDGSEKAYTLSNHSLVKNRVKNNTWLSALLSNSAEHLLVFKAQPDIREERSGKDRKSSGLSGGQLPSQITGILNSARLLQNTV